MTDLVDKTSVATTTSGVDEINWTRDFDSTAILKDRFHIFLKKNILLVGSAIITTYSSTDGAKTWLVLIYLDT